MDFNAVQTFIEVVRAGGFSAAARRVGKPRSTVSLHVRTLEGALGVRLLKRSTRATVLTTEGQALFEAASTAFDTLTEIMISAGAVKGEFQGPIRITAPADFPSHVLADAIGTFRTDHPKVSFEAILSNAVLDLVSDNIDIALRIGLDNHQDTVTRTAFSSTYGLFASPVYLERHGEFQSLDDVQTLIVPARDMRCYLERYVFTCRFDRPGIEANNFLLIRDLAMAGHGVGILPLGLCVKQVAEGLLRQTLTHIVGSVRMALCFPNRADMSDRVKAFADHWTRFLSPV